MAIWTRAVELIAGWIRGQAIPDLSLEVVRLEGRTPLLFIEVPGDSSETVLLYGHLDKQPPMDGWHDGLGPWQAGAERRQTVRAWRRRRRLRSLRFPDRHCGAQASGCSGCPAVWSLSKPVRRVAAEICPYYMDALADRIGTPSFVVCLDSGCGNYDQLWITTSLRGLVSGNLSVSTLTEGVHSGAASGIVPSSFRILRQLLSRLEDERTGEVLPPEFQVEIPRRTTATGPNQPRPVLGQTASAEFPFHPGAQAVTDDIRQLLLNRTWRPQLEITGDGRPARA